MSKAGSRADRGGNSSLHSRRQFKGIESIEIDLSFGPSRYTSTGQCSVAVWGKELEIRGRRKWGGFTARIHIHRDGNQIVYVLNGKEKRIPIEFEAWCEPSTIEVHWNQRSSHFRRLEVKAHEICTPSDASPTPPRYDEY